MNLKRITSISSTINMYQFQKNGLFSDKFLNTLMPLDDEPPLKDILYLNFPEVP